MDWLAGGDRHSLALERILDAADRQVRALGIEHINIDDIAHTVGCSRATVYRNVGGKDAIRDALLMRATMRIAEAVNDTVEHLDGVDRTIESIALILKAIRTDPMAASLLTHRPPKQLMSSELLESPFLVAAAQRIAGLSPDDRLGLQWTVQVCAMLLYWPIGDAGDEKEVIRRFVAPSFHT